MVNASQPNTHHAENRNTTRAILYKFVAACPSSSLRVESVCSWEFCNIGKQKKNILILCLSFPQWNTHIAENRPTIWCAILCGKSVDRTLSAFAELLPHELQGAPQRDVFNSVIWREFLMRWPAWTFFVGGTGDCTRSEKIKKLYIVRVRTTCVLCVRS